MEQKFKNITIALVCSTIVIFLIAVVYFSLPTSYKLPPRTPGYELLAPIRIFVYDYFTGEAVKNVSIGIFDNHLTRLEDGKTSFGFYKTNGVYDSGKTYIFIITYSNEYISYKETLPFYKIEKNIFGEYVKNPPKFHSLNFYISKLGDYQIFVQSPLGYFIKDDETVNINASFSYAPFWITIFNKADNTGFRSFYDYWYEKYCGIFLYLTVTPENTSIKDLWFPNFDFLMKKGNSSIFIQEIHDEYLFRDKVGNISILDGVFSTDLIFKNSIFKPGSYKLELQLYAYSDPSILTDYHGNHIRTEKLLCKTTFILNINK